MGCRWHSWSMFLNQGFLRCSAEGPTDWCSTPKDRVNRTGSHTLKGQICGCIAAEADSPRNLSRWRLQRTRPCGPSATMLLGQWSQQKWWLLREVTWKFLNATFPICRFRRVASLQIQPIFQLSCVLQILPCTSFTLPEARKEVKKFTSWNRNF